MRTERIVRRQSQREKLQELKNQVSASKPLIEADKQLRRAYMAGYKAGLEAAIEASKSMPEQSTEPSHDTGNQGSTQLEQETPVR